MKSQRNDRHRPVAQLPQHSIDAPGLEHDIGIEEQEEVAARLARPLVCSLGKAEIRPGPNHFECRKLPAGLV